jgi:hypothetical protein
MVWAPQFNNPNGKKWANLGDLQPPRPPERSGRIITTRQAEKKATPLAEFVGKPCGYCGAPMTAPPMWNTTAERTAATRDHAFPRAKGWTLGDFDGLNRVVCCYRCNQNKGANDVVDWYARLHAGRDPRAPVVFAVIVAMHKSQQTSPSFPAGVRSKLNLAILRVDIAPGSSAAMVLPKDAKTRNASPRRRLASAMSGKS